MDEGKRFESNFADSVLLLEELGQVAITRLYDPTGGFIGVANICDYIVGRPPHTYYFELKARKSKTNRINFKESLSPTQYDGMLKKSKVAGMVAGPIFKFMTANEAYFVDIRKVELMIDDGHKSITLDMAKEFGVYMGGSCPRVNWNYDIMLFLDNVESRHFYD